MQYPTANLLCIRKVASTLHDSVFSDLKWAINKIGVEGYWSWKESPLEITYKPTGQKILFRGMDDSLKLASITVDTGSLCWCWVEEAYELTSEDDFNLLDESIRGEVSEGLYKQLVITFNPWSDRHWLKARFFDTPNDENKLAMTTNYLCNEWLDEADCGLFERMKVQNPRRYQVAGLGNWGVSEGVIFERWEERYFTIDEIRKRDKIKSAFGMDLGFVDETALVCCLVDDINKEIFIFDEWVKNNVTNEQIYHAICDKGYEGQKIVIDCAEPKSIQELRNLGCYKVKPCRKGKDSVLHGIQLVQNFKIFIHPRCTNVIRDISQYSWDKDKSGEFINRPNHDFSHTMDALRYAIADTVREASFSFE